ASVLGGETCLDADAVPGARCRRAGSTRKKWVAYMKPGHATRWSLACFTLACTLIREVWRQRFHASGSNGGLEGGPVARRAADPGARDRGHALACIAGAVVATCRRIAHPGTPTSGWNSASSHYATVRFLRAPGGVRTAGPPPNGCYGANRPPCGVRP